jgi:hypothetical protein
MIELLQRQREDFKEQNHALKAEYFCFQASSITSLDNTSGQAKQEKEFVNHYNIVFHSKD